MWGTKDFIVRLLETRSWVVPPHKIVMPNTSPNIEGGPWGTMQALAACSELRPPVDISVGGDASSEGVGVGGARTEYRSLAAPAAV